MSNIFMRILLFFDLPSVTKKDIRVYTQFTKYIKKLGFVRMQESVYTKLSLNQTSVDLCMIDLKKHLPTEGIISVLTITEKQFSSMKHLVGELETDVLVSEEKTIKL